MTFRTRSTAAWSEALGAAGLRFAPVRDYAAVTEDPQVWENGYLAKVTGADGSEQTVVASPVWFSDTPATTGAIAPELGQHTEKVLLELGYDWDEIAALRAAAAI